MEFILYSPKKDEVGIGRLLCCPKGTIKKSSKWMVKELERLGWVILGRL